MSVHRCGGLGGGERLDERAGFVRVHGLAGDVDAVARSLGRANDLAEQAAERMHDAPPGQYWYGPGFFTVQHGLARHALRDAHHALDAAEAIEAGLAAMPAEDRESEWAATFRLRLATAYVDGGDAERAVATALGVADAADELGSTALRSALRRLETDLQTLIPAIALEELRCRM